MKKIMILFVAAMSLTAVGCTLPQASIAGGEPGLLYNDVSC